MLLVQFLPISFLMNSVEQFFNYKNVEVRHGPGLSGVLNGFSTIAEFTHREPGVSH